MQWPVATGTLLKILDHAQPSASAKKRCNKRLLRAPSIMGHRKFPLNNIHSSVGNLQPSAKSSNDCKFICFLKELHLKYGSSSTNLSLATSEVPFCIQSRAVFLKRTSSFRIVFRLSFVGIRLYSPFFIT
jgi:hypothetical protein